MIEIVSFGYKYGEPPENSYVIDCRRLANPYNVKLLRSRDGTSEHVQDWLRKTDPEGVAWVIDRVATNECAQAMADGKLLAFGCYGGIHRSPAVAEIVSSALRNCGHAVLVRHTRIEAGRELTRRERGLR